MKCPACGGAVGLADGYICLNPDCLIYEIPVTVLDTARTEDFRFTSPDINGSMGPRGGGVMGLIPVLLLLVVGSAVGACVIVWIADKLTEDF